MSEKPVNQIQMFFHCANCVGRCPFGMSPSEWNQTETGFTIEGVQVWCKRCSMNVAHIHFEGIKHVAMLDPHGIYPSHEPPSVSMDRISPVIVEQMQCEVRDFRVELRSKDFRWNSLYLWEAIKDLARRRKQGVDMGLWMQGLSSTFWLKLAGFALQEFESKQDSRTVDAPPG